MKRIIREVITLVRIERWLVRDDKPLTESNRTASNNDEQNIEHFIAESIVDGSNVNFELNGDDLRVIVQRILDSQQWEKSSDGVFYPKRFVNVSQTTKEVE